MTAHNHTGPAGNHLAATVFPSHLRDAISPTDCTNCCWRCWNQTEIRVARCAKQSELREWCKKCWSVKLNGNTPDASPSHHSQGLMAQIGGASRKIVGAFFVSSTVKSAKFYTFVCQQKGQPFFYLILSLLSLLSGNCVSTLSVNTRTHMYSQSCCLIFFVSTQPFSFPMCPPLIFLFHSCVSHFFPSCPSANQGQVRSFFQEERDA